LGDSTYLSSLGETFAVHILLFGSLIAGGLLSRSSRRPSYLERPEG